MKQKKALTLLEVLCAFIFLSLIFAYLMSTLSSSLKSSLKLRAIKTEAMERFKVHRRLFILFSNLGSITKDQASYYFYTEKIPGSDDPSLHFTVQKILDPNPAFSQILGCSLYVKDHKLILAQLPLKDPSLAREEILLKDVASIRWIFYKQKLLIEHAEQIKKIPGVSSEWEKEYCQLPQSLDLVIERANQSPLVFSFPLVSKIYPIVYP